MPFTIPSLLPGHLYVVILFGAPAKKSKKRTSDDLVNLGRAYVATDPEVPRIHAQNVSVTSNSISFSAEKDTGALQDYFLLTYSEAAVSISTTPASAGATWNVNVTDIAEQKRVEFYVGGLNAGSIYNVSVAAFRRGKSSKKWNAVIITSKFRSGFTPFCHCNPFYNFALVVAPLQPTNVRVISSDANEIVLAWDRPQKSGVDSYFVAYRGEFQSNATEVSGMRQCVALGTYVLMQCS